MYVIKSNRQTNSYTVRKINRVTQVVRVGRRGLQGETGPQGPKGDQGDPATNLVQSVNGKQGVVVLNATDVGADPTGSASQALQDAKDYTDSEVSTLDSSLATVAKTGSYNDLSNKPTIPSIAGLATEAQVQDVQDNLDAHEADTANPHNVTKAQVGLGNADNTSDANKPISTATQTALNAKANASDTVNLTGNQTIADVKTFSSSPVVPTATTNTQAVNKAQMDTAVAAKRDLVTAPNRVYTTNSAGIQNSIDYSNTGGAGTLAQRTPDGNVRTGTPVNNSDAASKSYADTADALKVNKAGDTMTGRLASTSSILGYGQTRGGNSITFGNNGAGAFLIYNDTLAANIATFYADGSGFELSGSFRKTVYGTGFPNGVVSAPVGSTYIDTNATNGAVEWKKATGTGNTGWVVSVGDTGWRNVTSLASSEFTIVNPNDYGYYIRRVNNEVQINIKAQTVASSWNGQSVFIPLGFRVADAATPVALQEAYQTASTGRGQIQAGTGLILVSSTWSTAGIRFTSNIFTTTTNAWPTTLPGTAV